MTEPPTFTASSYPPATSSTKPQTWRHKLPQNPVATARDRDRFATVLTADSELDGYELVSKLGAKELLKEIEDARSLLGSEVREGLAHTLAEAGLLPMFGMPTRVRNLYIDSVEDEEDESQRRWSTIDRDLDLANM